MIAIENRCRQKGINYWIESFDYQCCMNLEELYLNCMMIIELSS